MKWYPFSEVVTDATAKFSKIKASDYHNQGQYKIIDQGKEAIAGYTDEASLVNGQLLPIVIFGDHTRVLKYVDEPIALGADGAKALFVNPSLANTRYVYYYLHSIQIKEAGYSRHFKFLKEIEIPIPFKDGMPDLDYQIRIVNLLGKVEGLIAQRKQHLQQLDDLLKSVFLEMFGDPVRNEKGWEASPIEGLCEAVIDCLHSTPEYSEVGTGYYCVRSSDIVEGYLDLKKTYQVSKEIFEDRITRYRPQPNDIVYSREGGRLGNAARISGGQPICLGQRMMLFKVNSSNKPEFLWALLESAPFKSKLRGLVGGGAAPRVNIKDLKKLVVVKPSADLQELFSLIVLRVDQLRSRYEQSLTDLEALYGALSQQAFKGELDLSRVALPAVNIEGESPVAAAVSAPITTPVIELPETDLLLPALQDRTRLAPLLRFWLEAYRTKLGGAAFSVERFIASAQTRLAELHPDNDFEWIASDYESIKTWVFEALVAGALTQAFDDDGNRIELKAVAEQGLA
jgi:type I restriction enzyme S subunit